jgi:hypothetical protein
MLNMARQLGVLVLFGAICAVTGSQLLLRPVVAQMASPSPAPTINPLFASLLPTLKGETNVPVRLPASVPGLGPSVPLYANISFANQQSYIVNFQSAPNCNFAEACTAGSIDSLPVSSSIDLSIFSKYQTITLSNGDTAYVGQPSGFRRSTTIVWDESGQEYSIELEVVTFPTDLITMANSMTTY